MSFKATDLVLIGHWTRPKESSMKHLRYLAYFESHIEYSALLVPKFHFSRTNFVLLWYLQCCLGWIPFRESIPPGTLFGALIHIEKTPRTNPTRARIN
jgi:hypothetical protein